MKWGVVILSKEMGNQRSKRLALIVEDNELNRDMLAAILEDDFEIIQAENGLVGIEKLEGYHEELLLFQAVAKDVKVRHRITYQTDR